jgi:hypothetical protein
MQKKPLIIVGGATLVILASGVALALWRAGEAANAPPPPHAVMVLDRSDSSGCACEALVAQAGEVIDAPRFGKGSTLLVTETGDAATANEPVVIGRYDIPSNRRTLESRSKFERRRQAILDEIRKGCEHTPTTDISPVFIAVQRAAEHLKAAGCDGRADCLLIVFSDLEEHGEYSIRDAINRAGRPARVATLKKTSAGSSTSALPTVDNSAFGVVLAGGSETHGRTTGGGRPQVLTPTRDRRRAEQLREVWQSLFTDPKRVLFEPHCFKQLATPK